MRTVDIKVNGKECQVAQFETLQEVKEVFSVHEILRFFNFAYKVNMINAIKLREVE